MVSKPGQRARVVVVGMGDTGVLVAGQLAKYAEVVAVAPRPAMISGQELGPRLVRPAWWNRHYWIRYRRLRRLRDVRVVHGLASGVDRRRQLVHVRAAEGSTSVEPYDALVIASGVENGFWRRTELEDEAQARSRFDAHRQRLLSAKTVAVVGAGATGVSSAYNLARDNRHREVHLFFPGEQILAAYHPRVRAQVQRRLEAVGVQLQPGHRARLEGDSPRPNTGQVCWGHGQPPFRADAILWAVGQGKPNSRFLPAAWLNPTGHVRVNASLQVADEKHIFAVGDIAASDAQRSSARNNGHRIVSHNVRVVLTGAGRMRAFRAPTHRWGSILGMQQDGMTIYSPAGHAFWVPRAVAQWLFFDLALMRCILGGVRSDSLAEPDALNERSSQSKVVGPSTRR